MLCTEGLFIGLQFSGHSMGYPALEGAPSTAAAMAQYFAASSGSPRSWIFDYVAGGFEPEEKPVATRKKVGRAGESDNDKRGVVLKSIRVWLNKSRGRSTKLSKLEQLSLIYISCHAIFDNGHLVLLTSDTVGDCIFETGIPLHSIYYMLRQEGEVGRAFVLLLDCCLERFSGAMTERLPKNVSVMFACGFSAVAFQDSSKTYFVRDFLQEAGRSAKPVRGRGGRQSTALFDLVRNMRENCGEPRFFLLSNIFEAELPASSGIAAELRENVGITVTLSAPEIVEEKDVLTFRTLFSEDLIAINLGGESCLILATPSEGLTVGFLPSTPASNFLVCVNKIARCQYWRKFTNLSISFVNDKDEATLINILKRTRELNVKFDDPHYFFRQTEDNVLDISVFHGASIKYHRLNPLYRSDGEESDSYYDASIFYELEFILTILTRLIQLVKREY